MTLVLCVTRYTVCLVLCYKLCWNFGLCEPQNRHEFSRSEGSFLRRRILTQPRRNLNQGSINNGFQPYKESVDPQLIVKVIGAIDKTVEYYEKNYNHMNFDGIFGAKVVEGQLNLVVAEYSKGFLSDVMDDSMKNDIVKIATRAGHVVKLAVPYLYDKNAKQMKQMKRLLYLSWDIGHSQRMVDLSLTWSDELQLQAQTDTFDEEESNNCLAELLEPVDGMMCKMSEHCQHVMTKAGMEKYILSHQIIYSVVAEMSGCGSRLEQWLVKHQRSGSLEQLQGEMCSNLYSEALALAGSTFSDNIPTFRDLLLEMEFVCGMLGYVEFLRRDWLVGIFDWQSESGCFMHSRKHPTIGRKLLEEEKLPDGCLSHLTTVAVSALAVHLHNLLGRVDTTKQKDPPLVVSPVRALQPPPPPPPGSNLFYLATGDTFNNPLFREDFETGPVGSKVIVEEKSLEDKAEIVIQQLNERSSVSKTTMRNPSSDASKKKVIPPPVQSLPLAQYLAATKMSGKPAEYSMATFYFILASIILVMLGMVRYIHNKRRSHLMFRGQWSHGFAISVD